MSSQEIFDKNKLTARNYRIIREFRQKTQEEVGKETGISKQNISLWENRISNPGQKFIDRLASYFNIPKETFYVETLTLEYLEKNFSGKNSTPEQKSMDKKEKIDTQEDIYRNLVEGNTEYILIPRSVLQEKYRLVALEQFQKDKEQMDKDKAIIDKLLSMNESLVAEIRSMKTQVPELQKAQ